MTNSHDITGAHGLERLLEESAWVRSLARTLSHSSADAEDLVQETWAAALRTPPAQDRPVRPWLAGVVRNLARSRGRGAAHRRAREESVSRGEGGVEAPEVWLSRLELQEEISALVRGLPGAKREAVVMHFHEGLSGAEIARRLGVSAGTIRWRLKSGLDAIRAELDARSGGDRERWLPAMASLGALDQPRRAAVAGGAGLGAWAGIVLVGVAAAVAAVLVLSSPEPDRGGGAGTAVRLAGAEGAVPSGAAGPPRDLGTAMAEDRVGLVAPRPEGKPAAAIGVNPVVTRVRLRVVDPTGAPVAGAEVRIDPGGRVASDSKERLEAMSWLERARALAGLKARSDGSGRASLASDLLSTRGVVTFHIEGPGYAYRAEPVQVEPGDDLDLGDLTIAPRARITGSAVDPYGVPLTDTVMVTRLDSAGQRIGNSESAFPRKGRFEIFVDGGGEFELWIRRGGVDVTMRRERVRVAAGERGRVKLVGAAAPIPPHFRAVGPDGNRVAAAWAVSAAGARTRSTAAAEGHTLNTMFLEEGALSLRIEPRDLRLLPYEVELQGPYSDSTFELEPAEMGRLRLNVRSANGARLEGLFGAVLAGGSWAGTSQGDDGKVVLELPKGTEQGFKVRVAAEGHVEKVLEGVRPGGDEALEVTLDPILPIAGRVTHDGKPVPGAQIDVCHRTESGEWEYRRNGLCTVRWDSGHHMDAAADGTFSMDLQWPGDWVLRVRAEGFADELVSLTPFDPAKGHAVGTLELRCSGAVEGRLVDTHGAPVAGARVVAMHAEHEARFVRTSDAGAFRFDGLSPGDWTLHRALVESNYGGSQSFHAPEGWTLPTNARVIAGGVSHVELGDSMDRVVAGRLWMGAAPASGMTVSVVPAVDDPLLRGQDEDGVLRPDGSFEVPIGFEGAVQLSVRGGGLDGTARWVLGDGLRLDDLDLSFETAVVTVHALPGAPVSVTGDGTPAFWYRGTMPDGAGPLRLVVPAGLLTLKAGKAGEELRRVVDLLPGAEATLGRD